MSDFGPKWVRLALNGTNPRLYLSDHGISGFTWPRILTDFGPQFDISTYLGQGCHIYFEWGQNKILVHNYVSWMF